MPTTGAIKAGRAWVEIFADDSKLVRGLKSAQWKLKRFGQGLRGIGTRVAAAAGAAAVPLVISIRQAGDAMETLNKFRAVFGDLSDEADEFVQSLVRSLGRSRTEIRDALSSFQAFFLGLGFGKREAMRMSMQMEQLSIDFASFYNLQDPEALEKFQSGLAGMSRPLREYGINLLDSAVEQKMLAMGMRKVGKEWTQQQKVLARAAIIMEAMGKQGAVGDAERTAGSFQNRLKALRGTLRNLSEDVGMALLDVVTPLVDKLVKVVRAVGDWVQKNKDSIRALLRIVLLVGGLGVGLVALGTAIQLVAFSLGGLVSTLGVIHGLLAAVATVVGALASPIGAVVAALAALGGYLLKVTGLWDRVTTWLGKSFSWLKDVALRAFGGIKDALAAGDFALAARIAWNAVELVWLKSTKKLREAWEKLVFGVRAAWEIAAHALTSTWIKAVAALKKAWAEFTGWWRSTQERLSGGLAKLMLRWEAARTGRSEEWLRTALSSVDAETRAALARIESERQSRLKAAEDEKKAMLAAERERHREALADISREYDAQIDAAEKALDKARREYDEALEEARRKREQAEAEAPGKLAGLEAAAAAGVAGAAAMAARLEAVGTFTAFRLGGLGAGNALSRTAEATEETARNTEKLVEQANESRLVFGS